MPHYETVLIMRQDLSPSQAESIVASAQTNLKEAKAQLDRYESWGLRTLAYPIRKNRKGHYFIINHTNEPETTQEMQRTLSLNEDLLRLLTVKTAEPKTGPTPIAARMQREQETGESSSERPSSRFSPRPRTTEPREERSTERRETQRESQETPQETPQETRQETRQETPQETRQEMPQETRQETPTTQPEEETS